VNLAAGTMRIQFIIEVCLLPIRKFADSQRSHFISTQYVGFLWRSLLKVNLKASKPDMARILNETRPEPFSLQIEAEMRFFTLIRPQSKLSNNLLIFF